MSPTAFENANIVFRNAVGFCTHTHRIDNFAPVERLVCETGRIFRILGDEEGDLFRTIRLKVWMLRTTVLYALVPFDSSDIGLVEQLADLKDVCRCIPTIEGNITEIGNIIRYLVENPVNPKGNAVFELLKESPDRGLGVGLVSALTRGRTPGWAEPLFARIREVAPRALIIDSRKYLGSHVFRKVILPASGSQSPIFQELFNSFRTERLDAVIYRCEGFRSPERKSLPKGTFTKLLAGGGEQPKPIDPAPEILPVEDWMRNRFWNSLRDAAREEPGRDGQDAGRRFLVKARIIILANNSMVLLPEEYQVIEVSDLVEGRVGLEEYRKKFPRCRVDQLGEGDLIVLRTSGSGDYLIDVADDIMAKEGRKDLRADALDWKLVLKNALENFGSKVIAIDLEARGNPINDHRYIWVWTTHLVIRPHSEKLFSDLVNILYSKGYPLREENPAEAVSRRWKMMKDIIRYHIKAGHRIRESLLERLRKIISSGTQLGDCLRFSLLSEGAGEMAVYRVADVDREAQIVSYNKIGVIIDISQQKLWQE
jgi:hypothetical protein